MESTETNRQNQNVIELSNTSVLSTGINESNTTHGEIHITRDSNDEAEGEDGLLPITKSQFLMLNVALCVGIFMVTLDVIILATAIPTITHEFHSLGDVGWYGSAYLLTQTAFQPTFGKVYNYFNTKWTLLMGIMVFEIGSILCAAATSSPMLICGRAVAGFGAAAIFSGGVNIITMIFPLKHRAPFLGLMGAMIGMAMIVAPPLGGILTDRFSWRWCFWINLPCGGLMVIIIVLFLNQTAQISFGLSWMERIIALDPASALLLVSCITALLISLQWGGERYPWSHPKVLACIITAGILLVAFYAFQSWKGESAMIPTRLLRQRSILGSSLAACFLSMAFHVHSYYLPIYLQAVKGLTAEQSGIQILPYQVTNSLFSLGVGVLVGIVGWYPPFLWLGTLAFVVGSVLFYKLDVDSTVAAVVGYQIIAGAGVGTAINIPHIAVQAISSKKDVSSANAIVFFFHALGGAVGIGIAQNIFSISLQENLPLTVPDMDISAIIDDSSANIRNLIPAEYLAAVLRVYCSSIAKAFIPPIVTASLAFRKRFPLSSHRELASFAYSPSKQISIIDLWKNSTLPLNVSMQS
ncbi:MFS gliotoxin efflux transporter GliA [Nannizzia gypsea CBS 118893]|uniref:MFS gliotoxin efflux transporter GliA n=1 Tax=Arthroderma gypseum (strain ATCC MYA-4604 / CBS 118893) TaxID=535722 RepID=E4V2C3_ARTGP|nr:MFS gliotoxin efflux transporter GliA [Nannizzia gypsea CBS 118893]EFR04188.1 MFS gliotoxin efflux transporter GliA [Nannizzia gypsea CBS 118893]